MKIAIVGSVGVPARYGGFETLAEQLARRIPPARHHLVIYCQRSAYPDRVGGRAFEGHRRVFLPLRANGASSMLYDMLAMAHAAFFARADALLVLGYSGAWFLPLLRLLAPRVRVVTNIDGMEWRRDKFGRAARALLRLLEWMAFRFSDEVVADNAALLELARRLYGSSPRLIAYGGDHTVLAPPVPAPDASGYHLSIARIEPENNCHLVLEACRVANVPLVFIGNWAASPYGRALKAQYAGRARLTLMDPVYDLGRLASIRAGSIGYVHGHSVGGTNPSLVEALFHTEVILAFDCAFNRETLAGQGAYFAGVEELVELLGRQGAGRIAGAPLAELRRRYTWDQVVEAYLDVIGVRAG